MRFLACLVLSSCCALSGCTTVRFRDRLSLPENELATTERIERIIEPGMPIEKARQVLERYGFRCSYEEALGIPYLYCVQVKERTVWPFRATWSATIYHEFGLVTGVKGHYDPAVVERGTTVPPLGQRRVAAAGNKDTKSHSAMVGKNRKPVTYK
jgi:hypothetical protein